MLWEACYILNHTSYENTTVDHLEPVHQNVIQPLFPVLVTLPANIYKSNCITEIEYGGTPHFNVFVLLEPGEGRVEIGTGTIAVSLFI